MWYKSSLMNNCFCYFQTEFCNVLQFNKEKSVSGEPRLLHNWIVQIWNLQCDHHSCWVTSDLQIFFTDVKIVQLTAKVLVKYGIIIVCCDRVTVCTMKNLLLILHLIFILQIFPYSHIQPFLDKDSLLIH